MPLGDDVVAFSETSQQVLRLNPTATFVVRELQAGTSVEALVARVATRHLVAPDEAEQWLTSTLDALAAHNMLAGPPQASAAPEPCPELDTDALVAAQAAECLPYAPFQAAVEQHYRLLGTHALVRYGHKAQRRLVDAVIGHLLTEPAASPSTVIDIRATLLPSGHLRSDIYCDGAPVGQAPRLSELAPMVKAKFWEVAINAHDFRFYIHAGVVGTGRGCILLPAAPGSGKSSLTMALVHRGLRYYSDEVALIAPDSFAVTPMPLAMCVKSTGWDLMRRYHPEIDTVPTHRRVDGKVIRYIPPPAGAIAQDVAEVSHIVFPRYEAGAPDRLTPVARAEALGRLMVECLALRGALTESNVRDLVTWISGVSCYELTFSTLETAVALLLDAIGV